MVELQGSQRNIEAEIRDLEGELSRLKATRARLEAQGKVDLRIFSENILVLQNVWVLAEQDAKKIRTWLEEGANNAVSLSVPVAFALRSPKVRIYRNTPNT